MNRGSPLENNPMEDSQNSEEKCKVFKDICKYFSEEEWAKLGNSEKLTYVCMKKSYDIMTDLGLTANLPDFMRPKNWTTKSPEHDSYEPWNPRNQEFPDTSRVFQDFGNVYQQRTMLPHHPLSEERSQQASTIQLRKHLKVSTESEGPQSLSPCTDVNMVLPVKEAREENDMKPLPVSPDSEPAQKQLCPPGKVKASSQLSQPGSRKWKTNVWVHRLRERKNYVVYEEISDPEEEDD